MSRRGTLPQFGLCIDWETTGAKFGGTSSADYQGIQFGAIIFRTDTFEEVDSLKRLIKFDGARYRWDPEAERIHGLSREHLEVNGVPQLDAATALLELLVRYFPGGVKVLVLGHNAEFDISFTDQLLRAAGVAFTVKWAEVEGDNVDVVIPVHHVLLDTASLGLITLGAYKADQLFERLGFAPRGAHDALDDARLTLQAVRALRQIFAIGLNLVEGGQ